MDEKQVFKKLDKQKISPEQEKAIKNNKIKFIKLIKLCFKFCNPCKQIVSKGGDYVNKLCPRCKKIYEGL